MHVLRKGAALFDHVVDALAFLAGVLLVLLMLITCYEVVMRYFLHSPSGWVVEVCEYMLLFITFFGAPWLLRHDGHVRVDILLSGIRPASRRAMGILTSIVGAISCAFLVVYGAMNTLGHFHNKTLVIQTLDTPKWILVAVIPLGSFLLAVQFLRQCVALVNRVDR